ncbi:MAG: DUF1801 domain-containing protein [Gemmatimonadaceae bacterium]
MTARKTASKPAARSATKRAAKTVKTAEKSPAKSPSKATAKAAPSGKPGTHDAYLAKLPPEQRDALQSLRETLQSLLPGAEEVISYGIPAFRRGRVLAGYGATAKHCVFFLFSGGIVAQFEGELAKYETSKGAVRFQPGAPLPLALIKKLVKARLAEDAG